LRDHHRNLSDEHLRAIAATGGVISKGLEGYLGDNTDPGVVFNPAKANQDLQTWDPTGTKRVGLRYWFNTDFIQVAIAGNLQSAMANQPRRPRRHGAHRLPDAPDQPSGEGVHRSSVTAGAPSTTTHRTGSTTSSAALGRRSASATTTASATNASTRPSTRRRLRPAPSRSRNYQIADKQLIADYAYADLVYQANQYFIKPYVQGGGGNALYDNSWTTISILAH